MLNRVAFGVILLLSWLFIAKSQALTLSPVYQSSTKWIDDRGKQITLSEFQGKPVVITMAFATCRKYCTLTIAKLLAIQKIYDKRRVDAEFVVISYDPQNDTWQAWAEYRKTHQLFRKNWHFLTGRAEDTRSISQWLGMDYWFYDEHVMHNFRIVLLDAEGNIEKVLDWENQGQVDGFIPRQLK